MCVPNTKISWMPRNQERSLSRTGHGGRRQVVRAESRKYVSGPGKQTTIVNAAENLMKMKSTSGHRIDNVELVGGSRDNDISAVVGTEGKWLVK